MKNYHKLIVTFNLLAFALAGCSSLEGQNSLKKLVESGNCTPLIPLADGSINLPSGPIVHEINGVVSSNHGDFPFQKYEEMSGPEQVPKGKFGEIYWSCPNFNK